MICGQLKQPEKQNQVTVTLPDKYFQRSLFLPKQHPVDETHLVVVRGGGAYPPRSFTRVRQRGALN